MVSGGGRGTIIPVCSVVLRPDPAKNTLVSNPKMTTIYTEGQVGRGREREASHHPQRTAPARRAMAPLWSSTILVQATTTARPSLYCSSWLAAPVQGARAAGVGSRMLKMLHLHWILTHPRLHHPDVNLDARRAAKYRIICYQWQCVECRATLETSKELGVSRYRFHAVMCN